MPAKDTGRTPDQILPVLPDLPKDFSGLQLPNKRGDWRESGPFKALDALGSTFFDDTELLGPEAFLSIPDVWAQVEAYRIALTSERQAAYAMFIGEWRGLLAAIALQQEYGLQITPEEYRFVDSASPMAKVLSAHPPRSRIIGNGPWESVGILRLRPVSDRRAGVVIGLAVPNVIAVTSKNYRLELKDDLDQWGFTIPWLVPASEAGRTTGSDKRYYFADPCDERFASSIGSSRFKILEAYLVGLSENLRGMDGALATAVKTRLDAFVGDVRARAGRGMVNLVSKKLHVLPPSIGLPDTFTIYEESREDRLKSDFRIAVREGVDAHFSGAILIDVSLAKQLGADARNWRVWGTYTAADLQANPGLATRIAEQIRTDCDSNEGLRNKPYLPIVGDDLFSSAAVQIVDDTLVDESLSFRQFVYPFSPLVLTLFDPAALQRAARIDQAGDRVTARLAFEFQRVSGGSQTVEVLREYQRSKTTTGAAGEVVDKKLPPTMSLWPNCRLPGWSWNFGLYSGNVLSGNCVAVDGYASLSTILAALGAEQASRKGMAVEQLPRTLRKPRNAQRGAADGAGAGSGWDRIALHSRQGYNTGERRELHRMYEYPEAILLENGLRADTAAGGGFLLTHPKRDFTNGNLSGEAIVGIDFGTTNTAVYASANNGAPVRIDLARRYWSPRGESWRDENMATAGIAPHNELFPWPGRKVPFLTALRDRSAVIDQEPLRDNPILAATIFLEPDHNRYIEEIVKRIPQLAQQEGGEASGVRLYFDLKWSSVNWDRRLALYLSQLVLQSSVELLAFDVNPANIEWRFSYPEAFDPGKTKRFKEQTRDLVRKIYGSLGANLRPRGQDGLPAYPKVTYDKESVSAARYFVGALGGVSNPGHVVTIDIGGGTADLSIWYERKLVWRSSIPLAGKAILIDYIGQRAGILMDLLTAKGEKEAIAQLNTVSKLNDVESYKNAAEAVVNSAIGSDLFTTGRLLKSDGGTHLSECGPVIIRRSKLAFGAILYYIGLAYRELREQKDSQGKPLLPIDGNDDLQIYVGGRASILVQNLFDDEEDRADFVSLFSAASGRAFGSSQINFSNKPKEEVAFGLVVAGDEWGRRFEAKDRAQSVAVPAGEIIDSAGDGQSAATVWTDMRTLDANKPWRVANLAGLEEFLKLCRRFLRINVVLGPGATDRIVKTINDVNQMQQNVLVQSLKEQQDQQIDGQSGEVRDDNVALEAPFVRAVREILRFNADNRELKVGIEPLGGGSA